MAKQNPPPTLTSSDFSQPEPSCAAPCLTSALLAAGCGLADLSCQCGTETRNIWDDAIPCLLSSCDPSSVATAAVVFFDNPSCSSFSATAKGLGTGAKVGIGMGVTLGVLVWIALITAAVWHRRRQRRTETGTQQKNKTESKPNAHEMITDSNRHELLAELNIHEMEQQKQDVLTTLGEINSKPHQLERHGLDPNSRVLGPELQLNGPTSPYDLEPTPKPAAAAPSPFIAASGRQDSISQTPVAPRTEKGDEEGGKRKQDLIERIRVKKERLRILQERQLLEEDRKRASLEKARQTGGEASGGANR